jgi:hypothetical protein
MAAGLVRTYTGLQLAGRGASLGTRVLLVLSELLLLLLGERGGGVGGADGKL